MSVIAMSRLAREHELVAIVAPPSPSRSWLARFRRRPSPFAALGVPVIDVERAGRVASDVAIIASFPQRLPRAVLAGAKDGAFNLHMSLLPRHRGVDPVFSTYWDDDREAGITLHAVDDGLDTGPIVARHAQPLPRGLASRELYMQLAHAGADLLSKTLRSDALQGEPQAAAGATSRSAARIARLKIPQASWPAERAWHVLSGLGDQRHALLDGPWKHGRALAYRTGGEIAPGRVEVSPRVLEVHCADGVVQVERLD